jgi:transposase
MPRKKHIVKLAPEERQELKQLISSGQARARTLSRARILLKADERWSDEAISEALDVGVATVERVRKRFVEGGLQALHNRKPQREYRRKLDGRAEAHLIALSCSSPPEGHKRWTLRLLAEKLVSLEEVESVCHETVRQVLKKTNSSRGDTSSG